MAALFCFHPFQNKPKDLTPATRVLKSMGYGSQYPVENVFVSTLGDNELNLAFDQPKEARYTLYPQKHLTQIAKSLWGNSNKVTSRVIFDEVTSLRKAILRLEKHAIQQDCELLAVTASAHKAFFRWFLGSFTETLLDYSRQNLLIVPGTYRSQAPLKKVLFSTDLSSVDLKIFAELVSWCVTQKIELHVFHVPEPVLTLATGLSSEAKAAAQTRLNLSLTKLRKQIPVEANVHLKIAKTPLDVASQVLKEAQRLQVGLIVMNSKTSGIQKIVLGSIVKAVLRRTKHPVLVVRDAKKLFSRLA